MNDLIECPSCGGFVRADGERCPNCEAPSTPRSTRAKVGLLVGLVASSAFGLTLMACYGGPTPPPQDSGNPNDTTEQDAATSD